MTQSHPVQRGQRYNRIITAVFGVGVLSFFAGMWLDQTFAGLIVYAITGLSGVAALLYLQFVSSVELVDEREQQLHERASGTILMLFAYVGLPAIIGLYLLDAIGYYTIPPLVWGGIYAFSGLYLTWGVAYLYYRYRT